VSRSNPGRHGRQIETLRTQFALADGLLFAGVLSAERIEDALREEGATWREDVYTPLPTLWRSSARPSARTGPVEKKGCQEPMSPPSSAGPVAASLLPAPIAASPGSPTFPTPPAGPAGWPTAPPPPRPESAQR
jgi:hypothetical protein